jgi:hypothetical protein
VAKAESEKVRGRGWQALRSRLKPIVVNAAYRAGFEIRRYRYSPRQDPDYHLNSLRISNILASQEVYETIDLVKYCLNLLGESKSQLLQDLFVLNALDEKCGGYFAEFRAADGVMISNTFLLEKTYGWTGILAEPARCWHDTPRANRSCDIDDRCVWSDTGKKIQFKETDTAAFSTVATIVNNDYHASTPVEVKPIP